MTPEEKKQKYNLWEKSQFEKQGRLLRKINEKKALGQNVEKEENTLAQIDEKITQKRKALEQTLLRLYSRESEKERKARTHRLCELGGLVEKAGLGNMEKHVLLGMLVLQADAVATNPMLLNTWAERGHMELEKENQDVKEPQDIPERESKPATAPEESGKAPTPPDANGMNTPKSTIFPAPVRINLVVTHPMEDGGKDKDAAKAAGAHWDGAVWYVERGFNLYRVESWLPDDWKTRLAASEPSQNMSEDIQGQEEAPEETSGRIFVYDPHQKAEDLC